MTRRVLAPKAMWLRVSIAALLVVLACAPARSQEKTVELNHGSFTIIFEPPPGFAAVPKEEIAAMGRGGRPEKFAFAAPQGRAAILLDIFGEEGGEPGELSRLVRGLKGRLGKDRPNVKLLGDGPVRINGLKWWRLRYSERLPGGDTINELYVIDWAGQYASVRFVSPASTFAAHRAAFQKSLRTLQFELSVIAPAT